MNKPQVNTNEYFEYIENKIVFIESNLPVKFYGFTNYSLSGCWIVNGNEYSFQGFPIELFEQLIAKQEK